jgi:putative flavoprotein involved in K+ transport
MHSNAIAARRADCEEDDEMTDPQRHEEVDTVVIGGSQSGLAVGYHLMRLGRPFVILDAHDRVGDAWRTRWDSLRLFTTARYDGLPGMPFPGHRASYPTKDETADYLEAYAERFRLPVATGVTVERLSRRGEVFEVVAGERTFAARNVVVATGAFHTPRVPEFAEGLDPTIRQMHSSAYRHPSQLGDGEVLVVGAGNSGAEIALEASQQHRTWLSGRDPGQEPTRAGSLPDRLLMPLMWFFASRVTTVASPIGRKVRSHFLDPPRGIPLGRVRRSDIRAAGIERVPRTTGVRDGYPMLEDGRVPEVSTVVWCTGFVPDYSWIDLPGLDDDTYPEHQRGVVSSQPGLYFVGLLFLRALSSALLGGVGRDAEHLVNHIATRADGGAATATTRTAAGRSA